MSRRQCSHANYPNVPSSPPNPAHLGFGGGSGGGYDPTTSGATEGFGLMFYNARWYDPAIGRFAQADSIYPGGTQGLDRYAYVNNSPVRFIDPSGHQCVPAEDCYGYNGGGGGGKNVTQYDESLIDFILTAENGDVIVANINGESNELVFYMDPTGRVLFWNMNKGIAYTGISVLKYLSAHDTPIVFWSIQQDGTYHATGASNLKGHNGEYQEMFYPLLSYFASQAGMQYGAPAPGSNLPPSYENGYIQFHQTRNNDWASVFLTITGVATAGGDIQKIGPLKLPPILQKGLGKVIGVLTVVYAVDAFYTWLHDIEITDVTIHPGMLQPQQFNP